MKKIHYYISVILVFVLLTLPYEVSAASNEVNIEADGIYTVTDELDENLSVAKERAKLDALRNAVEKAGVYVESYTKSEGYQVTLDEIKVVAGKILRVDDSQIQPVTSNGELSYHCHIKAVVDISSVNIQDILQNKHLLEKSVKQSHRIDALENAIKSLKQQYASTSQENERLKIKAAVAENENNLKATLVQASDYTADELYETIKIHNLAKSTNLSISKMKKIKLENGKPYDINLFTVSTGEEQSMAAVILFTNKSRRVSKITISAPENMPQAKLSSYRMEYVTLGALGIEDVRAKRFMEDILSRETPFQIAIWDNWTNRNIAISHGPSPVTDSLFYIRITAYDKLFENEGD